MANANERSDDLMAVVVGAAKRLGVSVTSELDAVRVYAAERMAHLSTLIGQAGFEEAVVDERDNVMLRLALAGVDAADAADAELRAILGGALEMGVRALL